MTLYTASYGAGVQSTALLVLAARGAIPHRTFLHADVGADSEKPQTVAYLHKYAVPFAREHDLDLHVLGPARGQTLLRRMKDVTAEDGLREPIPVRGENGAPLSRSCTAEWKIAVVGAWLREHGATEDEPARVAIGFSTDEQHRMNTRRARAYETPEFPLIDLGMSRADCAEVIRDAGLPVPPKSSCWFCPFTSPRTWAEMRRDDPKTFEAAADLEDFLNGRREAMSHPQRVYLTRFGRPLREAIHEAQPALFADTEGPEECDEGYCWT